MFAFNIPPALAWAMLFGAGVFEIVWAVGLRYSDGFTRFWPSAITVAAMALSVILLGLSLKAIPLGTAYAIWGGIGTVGVAALGIWMFDEPATFLRIASIGMITLGIVGLGRIGSTMVPVARAFGMDVIAWSQNLTAEKAEKAERPRKPKLVRDSFTIPKAEYEVLDALKQRAARAGSPAKKSELLRAGIKALAAMSEAALLAALKAVPSIKTGRPAKA